MEEGGHKMKVFISYSSKEYDRAFSLKQILEANGIGCWMAPQSIPSGSDYSQEIPRAIRECDVFLLLLSEASQDSKWVPKELDNAISGGKISYRSILMNPGLMTRLISSCPMCSGSRRLTDCPMHTGNW